MANPNGKIRPRQVAFQQKSTPYGAFLYNTWLYWSVLVFPPKVAPAIKTENAGERPMQLRQLRYVLEVHRRGNHISAAAATLHTSQPGVSKQIQMLEHELGFDIFERTRNRVVGLTEPGREVVEIIQRVFGEIDSRRTIKDDYASQQEGSLTIATTHTTARYILPKVIDIFIHRYPSVRLSLHQANPTECCEAVESG